MRKSRVREAIFWIVFISLSGSLIFTIFRVIDAPSELLPGMPVQKVKADYLLMIVQCFLGIALISLPSILQKRINLELPDSISIVFFVFLYAAIYLGEIRSFYYKIPHWDTVLHTFSGLMLGALAFSIINLLNGHQAISLSPTFIALFAFCFAVAAGAVWEIYEFSIDSFLATNMQKYALESGQPLIGQYALNDTMVDLSVDCAGALIISVIGYFSAKREKGWVERFDFRKN